MRGVYIIYKQNYKVMKGNFMCLRHSAVPGQRMPVMGCQQATTPVWSTGNAT